MSRTNTAEKDTESGPKDMDFLDARLRPISWDEYVGQDRIKKNLYILLRAAMERRQPPEHMLFYGPPGLGKTTLAHLVAREVKAQIKITSGPAIERVGDLASLLTNLSAGDILFIDEAHRLNRAVEEVLYPAMESGVLDIILGKGPSARSIQLDLQPFTLIAATTRVGLLSSPLRSRFSGGVFKLEFYSFEELKKIIERSAKLLQFDIEDVAAAILSECSRCTPRIANYLLKRSRDYAQVHGFSTLTEGVVRKTLELLEIDSLGLAPTDRMFLSTIISKFNGGPVGASTLASALSEDYGTIEEMYEPFLMRSGLIERTQRGRVATELAYKHLKLKHAHLIN